MNLLIDTALKGSLLIAAAAAASWFLRGRSAAARHAAWTAAVIGHLALPALSVLMPEWRVPLIPSPAWIEAPGPALATPRVQVQSSTPKQTASKVESSVPVTPAPAAVVEKTSSKNSLMTWLAAKISDANLSPVALLWLLGSIVVLLRLAVPLIAAVPVVFVLRFVLRLALPLTVAFPLSENPGGQSKNKQDRKGGYEDPF